MKYIEPWKDYFKPFKIWGNLYFVGTVAASTHIIDTGEGLIMLDSGYQHSLYSVIDGIYSVGLNVHDLKYIIHTHGHIDHLGATKALVELTGAKTAIGKADRKYANGELDLTYAKELGMVYNETFEPDILLNDGDEITLGNTTVKCIATPGHTPGTMSFFFDVTDGVETYRAGLHGGAGMNTMYREFLDKYQLPYSLRDDFVKAMGKLAEEDVDIFLGNHMEHSETPRKYEELLKGNEKAFIKKGEFAEFCIKVQGYVQRLIEKEKPNGTV